MKKLIVASLIALSLLPGLTFAQTSVDAQIALLMQQIVALQAQIKLLQGSQVPPQPQAWCHTFNVNMGVGAKGSDVKQLMSVMYKEFPSGEGYGDQSDMPDLYRAVLASAVSAFQQKYASEILTPNGLKYPTGYVGKATRAKLNALYGCGVYNSGAPVISGVSGPTSLTVGQTGTWSISATDPMNGTLGYVVIWGDEQTQAIGSAAMGIDPYYYAPQQSTFTHVYTYPGTYKVKFVVKNQAGVKAESSITVNVTGSASVQNINLISPNGGETWAVGHTVSIGYTASNVPSGAYMGVSLEGGNTNGSIYLQPYPQVMTLQYPSNVSFSLDMVAVGMTAAKIQPGAYKVRVKIWDKQPCEDCVYPNYVAREKVIAEDVSDGYITITSNQTVPTLSYLQPSYGRVNTQVILTGNGFTATGNRIKFGDLGVENNPSYNIGSTDGRTLSFTVPQSNYMSCWYTSPSCMTPVYTTQPGNYSVSVINANGTSNAVTYTVTQ